MMPECSEGTCTHPSRYEVRSRGWPDDRPFYLCGVHVRPYKRMPYRWNVRNIA